MKRRAFLNTATAFVSTFVAPHRSLGSPRGSHYRLTAGPARHRLGPSGAPETELWLYNAVSPGPAIVADEGDELVVDFTNNLEQPTTIHWHGIRNVNEMDGVPGLTQPPIEPGETFIYRFPVNYAGTYWYHAHNKAWEQVTRGLYGPLIINDSRPNSILDVVLLADDWRLQEDYQLEEASLGSLRDWSHQGRLGNWLTINGQDRPVIKLHRDSFVRLRFINSANARTLEFEIEGRALEIIALDGAPCDPFKRNTIKLGPGQRVDVLLEVGNENFDLSEMSGGQSYQAAKFEVSHKSNLASPKLPFQGLQKWADAPQEAQPKQIKIHMQGGAMGNLSSAPFQGALTPLRELAREHSKLWAFNGSVGGYDHIIADLSLGQIATLDLWNDTSWAHSMHLHGHHFWVNSKEFGDETRLVMRDSYLMQPGEKAQLTFVADNPGLWLFHCHMLEHHAAGMGGIIHIF